MANSSATEPKVFKISRIQIGLSVIIQLLVIAGIIAMVNYLSFRHFKRWDYSRNQKYALSSQTKNLLVNLQKPVKAVIFFSGAVEIAPDVNSLLREYEFASNNKFNTEVVDPFRNFTRASELQQKYKFGASENILILDYDGKSKFVNAADMADYEQPDQMEMMMGQVQPRLKAFKGEQAITTALLELTEGKPNKIYLTTGHGEQELDGQELKVFNEGLQRQNIQAASLNLLNISGVPEDGRCLLIAGAKHDFSELEIKLLTDFWQRKGRVFVLLNGFAETPRLFEWLAERGVIPQRDRVTRIGLFMQSDPSASVPQFKKAATTQAAYVVLESNSSITRDLAGASKELLGPTQSLRIDRTKEITDKLKIMALLDAVENSWGETDVTSGDEQAVFDKGKDNAAPLTLAVAVEQGGVADDRVKVETARLVVVGNAELLSNNGYRLSEGISLDIGINALNWLLDREQLSGIPPKEKQAIALSLNEAQLRQIALTVMAIIPGIVAFLGLLSYWQRRA